MFVKICGTTNLPDAELAVGLGADALGFIFASSKRRVTAEQAAAIARFLPPGVLRVGVFTEPDVEEISKTVHEAGLTAVQMHWTYDRARVEALRGALDAEVELWQVVGFPVEPSVEAEDRFVQELQGALLDESLAVVLLDAVQDGRSGGQGVPFAWGRALQSVELARAAAAQIAGQVGAAAPRLVLAGGLRPGNVGEAIRAMLPWGVDVVSGVEMAPGRKSAEKMQAFVSEARETGDKMFWQRTPGRGRNDWSAAPLPEDD